MQIIFQPSWCWYFKPHVASLWKNARRTQAIKGRKGWPEFLITSLYIFPVSLPSLQVSVKRMFSGAQSVRLTEFMEEPWLAQIGSLSLLHALYRWGNKTGSANITRENRRGVEKWEAGPSPICPLCLPEWVCFPKLLCSRENRLILNYMEITIKMQRLSHIYENITIYDNITFICINQMLWQNILFTPILIISGNSTLLFFSGPWRLLG